MLKNESGTQETNSLLQMQAHRVKGGKNY